MRDKVQQELKQSFRPEFLNRIDATVVFRSLTVEEITEIVDLMLARVRDQLRAQQMSLEVTQAAKEHIIKLGYDVAYGARPLRRVIQNMVEDVLAEHLLLGKYEPGTTIVVDKGEEAGPRDPRRRREDPRRSRTSRPARPDGQDPEPIRLPGVRRRLPALGGPVPDLRRVEHPRRDRRPRAARAPRGGRPVAGRGVAARARSRSARVVEADVPRLPVGIGELDRVLGGGLVPGSLVLVGGEPGIGKSTLLLQAAAGVAGGSARPAATSCTRPARSRPARSACGPPGSGCSTGRPGRASGSSPRARSGAIVELARADRPGLVIVDSIQTATVDELDGPAGSVGQVRESALRLMELAKGDGIAVVLVGHVTKDGTIAGPKTLEHLVDAVLGLEGDRSAGLRLLRASKNRFGSTEEVGVFEMGELGLVELTDPARAFLVEHDGAAPGSVVAPTLEGSRPLLVEVQALVAPVALRDARGGPASGSTRTGSRCSSPSSAGGPGSVSAATTSTPTSPAA